MVLKKMIPALVLGSIASLISCNSFTKIEAPKTIEYWQTNADETLKLQKQNNLVFDNPQNNFQNILINPSEKFQTVDGFGYTLTGGSVEVINQLSPAKKKELLQDIFGKSEQSIGVSYLRLSIGASDLNSSVFSYDDVPAGQTDEDLSEFSLAKDQPVIDMLKEILAINPDIKIIGAPWSPPVWMKDNGSSIGGSLKPEFYNQSFVGSERPTMKLLLNGSFGSFFNTMGLS